MCQFEDVNIQTPIKKIHLVCPSCQSDLTIGSTIWNMRTGTQKNTLSFNREHNWFDWQEYEFNTDAESEEYTCVHCNADVSLVIKHYI
jgi:hypothetical protein